MLQIFKLMPQGTGLAPVLVKRASTVNLTWTQRQVSHFEAKDSAGRALHVTLPQGTVLRANDVLVGEDGSLIRVIAAPQAVLKITPCAQHGSPLDLIRAAYHLGQRQVPVELQANHLKMVPDAVLADQLRAMHLTVNAAEESFEPESSASVSHRDGHNHPHGNAEAGPSHAPTTTAPKARSKLSAIPIAAVSTPHVHGPGCGHGH
jgi:urease accessory protein